MTAGTQSISLDVNGRTVRLTIDDPAMPLLYALRNDLGLHGPRKRNTDKPVGGGTAKGRGMAFVKYENNRTYVGMVATVEIVRATGVITAKHFAVVQDCGQIINPDGAKNQIEGNVVQTVSRTLIEQVHFDRSRVTSIDWSTYPILTFPDVPQIDIELIDRPTEKPWGVGEPSSAIVSAAISNAVFDAIGVRLRSVPFSPQKTLDAIHRGARP